MLKKVAIATLLITLVGCSNAEDTKPKNESKKVEVVKEIENEQEQEQEQVPINPLTDLEKAYLDLLSNSLDIYSDNLNKIVNLIKDLENEPSLAKDQNWIDDLNDGYVMMIMLNRDFTNLEDEGKVSERYAKVNDIMQSCLYYMIKSKESIPNDIPNAKNLIIQSNEEIANLDVEITRISDELGLK